MKYLYLIVGLLIHSVVVPAQVNSIKQPELPAKPLFTWDLLWTGAWEESKTFHNRGDFRFGYTQPGLLVRGQALDRRPLNFQLDPPWGDPAKGVSGLSFGMYHQSTGSRLLYGVLDEWGLPARIRSPWIRSAPYTENHKPVMADLKTVTSTTKEPEAYLYLSSPRFSLFGDGKLPEMATRVFVSMQFPVEKEFSPAFSCGLDASVDGKTGLSLEGFYTGTELAAKQSTAWFSDPPPLPARDFRLGAAAMMFSMPYFSVTSDWAFSQTFAFGAGVYGNAGIRVNPPLSWTGGEKSAKPGPWSLSLSADGMGQRYIGRDGTSPGGGFRIAGKLERKGQRSSLFRATTSLRGSVMGGPFERSSSGIYYRFPTLPARAAAENLFPLRMSRISFGADRNASDWEKIHDSVDGTLGLSLALPPILLPTALLSASAKTVKNPKPKSYPISINFTGSLKSLGSSEEEPSPYPFFSSNKEFDSAKTSCELLWSPGIFQFRTRWAYTVNEGKDNLLEASFSAAVRFKHGRFSAKMASPNFPDKWNCTLSWRLEK